MRRVLHRENQVPLRIRSSLSTAPHISRLTHPGRTRHHSHRSVSTNRRIVTSCHRCTLTFAIASAMRIDSPDQETVNEIATTSKSTARTPRPGGQKLISTHTLLQKVIDIAPVAQELPVRDFANSRRASAPTPRGPRPINRSRHIRERTRMQSRGIFTAPPYTTARIKSPTSSCRLENLNSQTRKHHPAQGRGRVHLERWLRW